MQQKYEVGTGLTYFWHKNEIKISLNFIFVFEPLLFQHTYLSFLLSKLASQINLIQSVVGFSCYSQGLRVPLLGSQVPCPRVTSPKAQGPSSESQGPKSQSLRSQGSGSQDPCISESLGLRVLGPGSQVSGPDFRLCLHFSHTISCDAHFSSHSNLRALWLE